jgi:hypothetical protein
MRRLAILLLASLAFPAAAATQNPDIPLDLAKALLAGGGSPWNDNQWVEIVVGGAPRQWKIEELSGLRILGSAAFPTTATVVYAVDGDLATAQSAAIADFEAAGWKLPPPPQRPPSMESGFIATNDVFATTGPRRPMCKADRGVMINPLEMPSGPRVLRVVYMGTLASSMCNPPTPSRAMRDPWSESPMPRLEAPAGARVHTSGRSGGSHSLSSDALAFTQMAVDKLLAHYAEQMRAKGWQPNGPAAIQKATALQAFQIKHNEADWSATLIVSEVGDDMRDLQVKVMNVTEMSKRRGF